MNHLSIFVPIFADVTEKANYFGLEIKKRPLHMNQKMMKWSLPFTDGLQTSLVRVTGYMTDWVTLLQK